MATETVRVTAYLDPELARRVRVLAAQKGVRQTDVMRVALEEYLNREEKKAR